MDVVPTTAIMEYVKLIEIIPGIGRAIVIQATMGHSVRSKSMNVNTQHARMEEHAMIMWQASRALAPADTMEHTVNTVKIRGANIQALLKFRMCGMI